MTGPALDLVPYANDSPCVSVVMPVRNGEQYLDAAVESIRNQTFPEFEFIIVDDASTDCTPALLKAVEDPRVRIITNQDALGISRSLNLAIEIARGRLIARMDADDIASDQRLERQVEWMERYPEVVLCGTFAERIDADGNKLGNIKRPQTNFEIQWHLLTANPFIHPSVMFRAEVFRKVGGYESCLSCAQDYDLWCRLAKHGECCNLSEQLMQYRFHANAISAQKRAEQMQVTQQRSQQRLMELGIADSPEDAEMFQAMAGRHLTEKSIWEFDREQLRQFPELVDRFFDRFESVDDVRHDVVQQCRQRLRARILGQVSFNRAGFRQTVDLLRIATKIDPAGMKLSSILSRFATRVANQFGAG